MRILVVTHYFFPSVGGIERVAANHVFHLAEAGHEVAVVTNRHAPAATASAEDCGQFPFPIFRGKTWNVLRDHLGIPYPLPLPSTLLKLWREMKRADVVCVHGHSYLLSLAAALASHFTPAKLVVFQHNTFIEYGSALLRVTERTVDHTIGWIVLASADLVLACSEATLQYCKSIAHLPPARGRLCLNGVDTKHFTPSLDKQSARRALGFLPDEFVCLCVRRMTEKNGIGFVLSAAEHLQGQSVRFVLCGSGPDLDTIRAHSRERALASVDILGFVPDERLIEYFRAADCLLLPSLPGEGFPIVILEAWSCALEVVATRSGGHVEFMEAHGGGKLVDVGDVERFAAAILELRAGRQQQTDGPARAREIAVEYFDSSTSGRRFETECEQLLEGTNE